MPPDTPSPSHVLTTDAVRWGIDTLGAQKLHPTFVMYLYLRAAHRAGLLEAASASSDELLSLIEMPGNPTKPYYFPLIDRGARTSTLLPTFWRSPNIPGSWSPGSISRQRASSWLGVEGGGYAMPDNNVDLAFTQMLYGSPVSAVAMGAYFLRNDGFVLSGVPDVTDLVAAFRRKFDYPEDTEPDFRRLFTTAAPVMPDFEWFEPAPPNLLGDADGDEELTGV